MKRKYVLYTNGKRGAAVAIEVTAYDNGSIVASADSQQITPRQMEQALEEFTGREFGTETDRENFVILARSI